MPSRPFSFGSSSGGFMCSPRSTSSTGATCSWLSAGARPPAASSFCPTSPPLPGRPGPPASPGHPARRRQAVRRTRSQRSPGLWSPPTEAAASWEGDLAAGLQLRRQLRASGGPRPPLHGGARGGPWAGHGRKSQVSRGGSCRGPRQAPPLRRPGHRPWAAAPEEQPPAERPTKQGSRRGLPTALGAWGHKGVAGPRPAGQGGRGTPPATPGLAKLRRVRARPALERWREGRRRPWRLTRRGGLAQPGLGRSCPATRLRRRRGARLRRCRHLRRTRR
mmetsp:Transcript_67790/g.210593  ORF Transcript_67790/g.210593 Transcript_67790/m.210593 type:complete len:277 (+) Transcript_67790:416-1246(+)